FRVPAPASGDCRVEASLTGFDTSIVPCTFLDSEILQSTSPGSVVFQQGQWLFRRPRHSEFVELTWTPQQPPLISNPGCTRWDGRVSYQLSSALAALVAVDNVGDADCMEPLGYRALRRAARAGFGARF